MKSLQLHTPGELEIRDVPVMACPEGGLLLKTMVCSICSTDVKMYRQGHRDLVYPRVPGHEIVGEVIENRSREDFAVGDIVQLYPGITCGKCIPCRRGEENQCASIKIIGFNYDGGFAEYVSVPAQSITEKGVNKLPAGVSPEYASMAEPLASCINAQEISDVKKGDTVLIVGAGPLGILQAMLARHNGAKKILVSEPLDSRRSVSELVKIDRFIDPEEEDLVAVIDEETSGVDVILITFNGADVTDLVKLLAPRGRICLFSGLTSQKANVTIDANLIHYRDLRIVGAYGSTARQNRKALELIASGEIQVDPVISASFRLEEFEKAVDFIDSKQGMKALICFQ